MKIQASYRMALAAAAAVVAAPLAAQTATNHTIIDDWASVAVPPPPALQPAALNPVHTALLVLDMNAETCTPARRPSCARSVPSVKRLLDAARAHKVLVIYSTGPGATPATTRTPDGLAALPGETTVRTGADKFLGSDLDAQLKAHGIRTVIVTGTSAQGAVLYTASSAALRQYDAVVPVDAYSGETQFSELYTAWHLKNAPATISSHITLTRSDMVTFR